MANTQVVVGMRARFFHPFTFGTMEDGTVVKILSPNTAKVRFVRPDHKGRHLFVVDTEHFNPSRY